MGGGGGGGGGGAVRKERVPWRGRGHEHSLVGSTLWENAALGIWMQDAWKRVRVAWLDLDKTIQLWSPEQRPTRSSGHHWGQVCCWIRSFIHVLQISLGSRPSLRPNRNPSPNPNLGEGRHVGFRPVWVCPPLNRHELYDKTPWYGCVHLGLPLVLKSVTPTSKGEVPFILWLNKQLFLCRL